MTVQNDFLAFATGGGATVQSQAAWVANPVVTNGFQVGIADESQCNKAWRQSSVMASCLAQFVANTLNANVLDNGDTTTLTTQITNAIGAASASTMDLVANGYMKFANGLVLQWGTVTTTGTSSGGPFSFPTAFPNACLAMISVDQGSPGLGSTGLFATSVTQISTTQFNAWGGAYGSPTPTFLVTDLVWFAVGH